MMPNKRRRNESGAAMVEFAIILPLLLLILFGTIEFGLLLYNQQVITNASREGARAGIVARNPRATKGEIESIVDIYCENNLITFGSDKESYVDTEPDPINPDADFQDPLTVIVSFNYSFLVMPAFIQNLANFDNLQARTTMKYE